MTHKICFINRSSIHYRKNIYMLMDQELPCDFYFGDSRPGKIAPLDVSLLKNFKGYFHNVTFGRFYWQRGSLSLLRKGYTDIITVGDPYCLSFWLMLIMAKIKGINIYMWGHGAYGDESFVKKISIRLRMWLAKGMFLYGEYAKNILISYGIKRDKLYNIYNSLAYDEQLALRSKMESSSSSFYHNHFGNKNFNIVFIGRLTVVKKLDQILQAVSILKGKGMQCNVTFVGDGMEKSKLEALTSELNLQDNVWFYGACYDENEISLFLRNADVCVSPGNVGLTAMHAMSFGCPVISHNNFSKQMPEFEAIEEGKTGEFFKEDDVEDLAATIKRWLLSCGDREKVMHACYEVIDTKYNPHLQVEIMKNVIIINNK